VDEIGFIAAPRKGTSPIGHCRPFRPDAYQHPCRMQEASHPADRSRFRTLDLGTTCNSDLTGVCDRERC